jgi:hypothetical protein
VWISDDADRITLRFVMETKYGEVEAVLVRYGRSTADAGEPSSAAQACAPVAVVHDEPEDTEEHRGEHPGFLRPRMSGSRGGLGRWPARDPTERGQR